MNQGRPKLLNLAGPAREPTHVSSSHSNHATRTQTVHRGRRFAPRTKRIDWRSIVETDVEAIHETFDVDQLQNLLENITFSNIDFEERYADAQFLKAFRLAQLLIEYLLQVQNSLLTKEQRQLSENKEMESRMFYWENRCRSYEQALRDDNSNQMGGPSRCDVCREAFETIEVMNNELHVIKGLLKSSQAREAELLQKIQVLQEREREHQRRELWWREEQKKEQSNLLLQQLWYKDELQRLKDWMNQELALTRQIETTRAHMDALNKNKMILREEIRMEDVLAASDLKAEELMIKEPSPPPQVRLVRPKSIGIHSKPVDLDTASSNVMREEYPAETTERKPMLVLSQPSEGFEDVQKLQPSSSRGPIVVQSRPRDSSSSDSPSISSDSDSESSETESDSVVHVEPRMTQSLKANGLDVVEIEEMQELEDMSSSSQTVEHPKTSTLLDDRNTNKPFSYTETKTHSAPQESLNSVLSSFPPTVESEKIEVTATWEDTEDTTSSATRRRGPPPRQRRPSMMMVATIK
ncbi:zinc finger protein [Planoprotostelium fungivorum]|uniref:Zinc finger protein n=1 Tax=Planoprotostelium fungivorum TaxID=1890364 RepID=A0A2P6MYY5_9EUKA|nr:zinc finger protein [Planoprotostelium fungivorum]